MQTMMSGECDDCGEHTLECICGSGCPCRQQDHFTHLNIVPKRTRKYFLPKAEPLAEGENPPEQMPDVKYINVRGRDEHEAIIKDKNWCRELGLDQAYEVMVYLRRWGSWLSE